MTAISFALILTGVLLFFFGVLAGEEPIDHLQKAILREVDSSHPNESAAMMEKLLEEISFTAGKTGSEQLTVDGAYVDARLGELSRNEDLSRYVL